MDIKLKKKNWFLRHKGYLAAGLLFILLAAYTLSLALGSKKRHVSAGEIVISEVKQADFLEYIESEGLVEPMIALKVNSRVDGYVRRIVAEEGTFVKQGDTLLVLDNPNLLAEIGEQENALQKQLLTYKQEELEMEQKSITLRKQALTNQYELQRLADNFALSREEFRMGIKSKAELELERKEYDYKKQSAELERQSLRHDSAATVLRQSLINAARKQEIEKFRRIRERRNELVVRAPASGQLSSLQIVPGQQLQAGGEIGEIKVLDRFKVRINPSEYYIDRIAAGLPARAVVRGKEYPMAVRRVVPEVVERSFVAELGFTGAPPEALRIGQRIRVQIEIGSPEETLSLPRGDFYNATGGRWIFKVDESGRRAVRAYIRLGRQNPKRYEVVEGLKKGDRVITSGYARFENAEALTWSE
ncbi:MAG: efflux RND transporter periplasmic adaptor subunit [Bacteroidaceae bacterium]|jgi:multidrug efflux pump subunit AcrA (membrane-fusion protein)